MKCASCDATFNDGVQCCLCKRRLDFGCANITESGYRRLGSDRRAAWKCSSCRIASPAPTATQAEKPESTTLDAIMAELQAVKKTLANLPILHQDIKSIKDELADLKTSIDFNGATLLEYGERLNAVEKRVSELDLVQGSLSTLQNSTEVVQKELSAMEQRARLNNIEIKGVPIKNNENLFSIVDSLGKKLDYTFPKSSINYITRVPVYGSNDKSIIVSFINRYVKEELVAAARIYKTLTAQDIGFQDNNQRIYINDHLTPQAKGLLTRTKSTLKTKDYKYIWVKYGKIHVRKNDSSRIVVIGSDNDLNKLT